MSDISAGNKNQASSIDETYDFINPMYNAYPCCRKKQTFCCDPVSI